MFQQNSGGNPNRFSCSRHDALGQEEGAEGRGSILTAFPSAQTTKLLCPACDQTNRRNANGSRPILRNGRECRRCGFVYAEAKEKGPRNYKEIAERAWVTRKERYGPSGMRSQDRYAGIEMFS